MTAPNRLSTVPLHAHAPDSALEIGDRLLDEHRQQRLALKDKLQPDPLLPLRRVYVGTLVQCSEHPPSEPDPRASPPPKCRVRKNQFCAVGTQAYWVEGSSRMACDTRQDCVESAAAQRMSRLDSNQGVPDRSDNNNTTLLPLIDLTLDEDVEASLSDGKEEDDDDACMAFPVDVFADVLDPSLTESGRFSTMRAATNSSNSRSELLAALERGRWVCYTLQSTVNPRRTYVGVTNDRFKRLRMHNGEITGGARFTRSCRPYRMVCLVFGFSGKIDALRFEWSMHNPRKRRLKAPHSGVAGRRNCARQLLASPTWAGSNLRFAALPLDAEPLVTETTTNNELDLPKCLATKSASDVVALLCDA